MEIEDFDLTKIVVEIRYSPAYLLWDNCGAIWREASSIWPSLKPTNVDPNKQSFRVDDKYEFSIELDKAFMIAHYCKVKDIKDDQESFIKLVRNGLKIDLYERVGTRFIYELECDDGSSKLIETGLVNLPPDHFFNIRGTVTPRQVTYLNEDDDIGAKIVLQLAVKKFELEQPLGLKDLEIPKFEKNLLIFDVDYFTKKALVPGQLNLSEWVGQIDHAIKRDSHKILNG